MFKEEITSYCKNCFELEQQLDQNKDRLKAKEQECEELKKIINEAKNSKLDLKSFLVGEAVQNEYEQQLDQLKAENEELKRQHQGDKGLITSTGKMNYQLLQEYDKLKNCLTEIKEIAEKSCCTQPTTTCEEYDNCQECGRISDEDAVQQILQKISEVLE